MKGKREAIRAEKQGEGGKLKNEGEVNPRGASKIKG